MGGLFGVQVNGYSNGVSEPLGCGGMPHPIYTVSGDSPSALTWKSAQIVIWRPSSISGKYSRLHTGLGGSVLYSINRPIDFENILNLKAVLADIYI